MTISIFDSRISLIDLFDLQLKNRTGAYIIRDGEDITIIETSASPSIPYLKQGLAKLHISLDSIKYIIVTHVHLDHAGGVGLFLKDCPNAMVVIHPKGRRHLIDPLKLEAGARAVYQERFDSLFSPIIPVPENRVITKHSGETLQIGNETTLTFYDTPGHANHHFSIYDPISNGIFVGDTAGVQYQHEQQFIYLPSTSPNQFDPNAMKSSLHFFSQLHVDRLYFGHYGMTEHVPLALDETRKWLNIFVDIAEKIYNDNDDFQSNTTRINNYLYKIVEQDIKQKGIPSTSKIFEFLNLDIEVSSMGLVDYLQKKYSKIRKTTSNHQ